MEQKSLSNNIFFHFSINSSIAKSYTKQRAPEEVVEMADHSDAGAALFIFCVLFFGYGIRHCYLEAAGTSSTSGSDIGGDIIFYRYLLLEWNKSGKGDNLNYRPHRRRR
jgi:hypothetical protein